MKRFVTSFIIFISLSNSVLSSPLIYKVNKIVITNEQTEIGNFDALKYKQVRIGIKFFGSNATTNLPKSIAENELKAAERELSLKTQQLEEGKVSRVDYDTTRNRRDIALLNYNKVVKNTFPPVSIYAIEGSEDVLIAVFDESNNHSIVIDSPPSKIKITASGQGKYSLFVWASLN
jgi:hypothetical protein